MSYLLDTNVISEFFRKRPNINVLTWLDDIPEQALFVSVLTIGEIRKGIEKTKDTRRKEKIRIWLEHDIKAYFQERILKIDDQIAERWGRLMNETKNPPAAIDSLIAATALAHDLRLVTRNVSDFQYPALEVINPWNHQK